MKKRWKIAGGVAAGTGLALYGGVLSVFRSFFLRSSRKTQHELNEEYYAFLERGPFAHRVPDLKEGIAWLHVQKHEDWYLNSFDGLRLHARFFENPAGGNRVALLSHGYHSSGEHDFGAMFPFYWEQGFHLLIIDQRAHEGSEGKYICFGVKERHDLVSWCKWLVLRRSQSVQILIHGVSMGCTTALLAAALPSMPENLIGVVADCGFTSPYEEFLHVARKNFSLPAFPLLPLLEVVCRHRAGFGFRELSTIDEMAHIRVPIFFVHGEKDTFVLPEHTRKNYAACGGKKELLLVPEAGHALSYLAAPEEYQKKLLDFLENCCGVHRCTLTS